MFKKIISLSILLFSIYFILDTFIQKTISWKFYQNDIKEFYDSKRVIELEFPKFQIKRFIKIGTIEEIDDNFPTLLVGNKNNIIIAGHDRSHIFHFLHNLKIGNEVIYKNNDEEYFYQITNILVVKPEEIQYLEETTNKQLTLITCTEHNQKRLIIICQINGEKNKMIS